MEGSDPISICTGCKRKLIWPRKKFEWDIARGFSAKDAAARALYDPGLIQKTRTCCVVNLQTNFDATKDLNDRAGLEQKIKTREYEEMKKSILASIPDNYFTKEDRDLIVGKLNEMIAVALRGEPFFKVKAELMGLLENTNLDPAAKEYFLNIVRERINVIPEREIVKVYVANEDNTIGGTFMLEDINVDRLADLAARFPEVTTYYDPKTNKEVKKQSAYIRGFEVTNIAFLPESVMRAKKWKEPVLTLWSGVAKIIPVINKGGEIRPAKLWLLYNLNGVLQPPTILSDPTLIKSLLQSEIIDASNVPLNFQNIGTISVDLITLRKQFTENIVV
jgi:hypothetical protein